MRFAEHTSYPTRIALGGEEGQIREGDEVVTPAALEPILPQDLKRLRRTVDEGSTPSDANLLAQVLTTQPPSPVPVPVAASSPAPDQQAGTDIQTHAMTTPDSSRRKMSLSALLEEPAPEPASGLSISEIINPPGDNVNVLRTEDIFGHAAENAAVADNTASGFEVQVEDEEVLHVMMTWRALD